MITISGLNYYQMADAIYIENLPTGLDAYGGYVAGSWPTYDALVAAFPTAKHLSITPFASYHADCLDIENGDATVADAPEWLGAWQPGNTPKPVLYTSAANLANLISTCTAAEVPRGSYLIWSAHYIGQHICGPDSCGYAQADGTQYADPGPIDESILSLAFFRTITPPIPAPTPTPTGDDMPAPCVFTTPDGNEQSFYVDADGKLNHYWFDKSNTRWSPPSVLASNWAPNCALSMAVYDGIYQVWGQLASGTPGQCYLDAPKNTWVVIPLPN